MKPGKLTALMQVKTSGTEAQEEACAAQRSPAPRVAKSGMMAGAAPGPAVASGGWSGLSEEEAAKVVLGARERGAAVNPPFGASRRGVVASSRGEGGDEIPLPAADAAPQAHRLAPALLLGVPETPLPALCRGAPVGAPAPI